MTKVKNFVIDTNVLLNDPSCIKSFGDNNVIIPFVVLAEIDTFKKGTSSLASAARSVSRILDELREKGDFTKGIPLESGGKLIVPKISPKITFTDSEYGDKNDNIILQTCLELNEDHDDVVLITEDINLRVRGSAAGIETQKHDGARVEDTSFYDGVNEYHTHSQLIDDIFSRRVRVDVREFEERDIELGVNEYFVLKSVNDNSSALACNKSDHVVNVGNKGVYGINARNKEQEFALDAMLDPNIKLVVLSGKAGCGKTLLSLAAGLEQSYNSQMYESLLVSRPNVSMGEDLGYLPGDLEQKLDPWMYPIYDNLSYLHKNSSNERDGRDFAQDLKQFGNLEMSALSYIRGRSISDRYVIIDEAQNLSSHEIKTIVTRIGEGSKLVVTGDPYQIDNPYLDHDSNALSYLIDRMTGEDLFASVVLTEGERSELAEVAAQRL